MITITFDILSTFAANINYPQLETYLDNVTTFFNNDYPQIVAFYSGKLTKIAITPFTNLNNLITQAQDIDNHIINNTNNLTQYTDFEVVDYLQEVEDNLLLATKVSKFLRSSITNFNFSNSIEFTYSLRTGQTLENAVLIALQDKNFDNDWSDIAVRNNLFELSYDTQGGNQLYLSINKASTNIFIKTVIDNITGQAMYGKDIAKNIQFVDNDLNVLGYQDTLNQSVNILSTLQKGDVPEFPNMGISKYVGKSAATLGFSTLSREMSQTFSSDDSLVDFSITKASLVGSDLSIVFNVSSRLGKIITQSITV